MVPMSLVSCFYVFALDVEEAADVASSSYHTCQSVKLIPKQFLPQSGKEATLSII